MLDFLACRGIEKLIIDAEAIASAQRLIPRIEPRTESLVLSMLPEAAVHGDFLQLNETRAVFRSARDFPWSVIERGGPPMERPSDLWSGTPQGGGTGLG